MTASIDQAAVNGAVGFLRHLVEDLTVASADAVGGGLDR
jgi:hypothetical protein